MGLFHGIYIRCSCRGIDEFARSVIDRLRNWPSSDARGTIVRYQKDHPWICLENWQGGEEELVVTCGFEVVVLLYYSVSSSYMFMHYVEGKLRRELHNNTTSEGWSRVVGDPEPWEADFLFANRDEDLSTLKKQLLRSTENFEKKEYKKLIDALNNYQILQDSHYPWTQWEAFGEALRLPGFGPDKPEHHRWEEWWTFKEVI